MTSETASQSRIIISPSLIASDLSMMGKTVTEMDPSIIDMLHLDIMDGNFVPNLTFGPGYIKSLQAHTSIPFDAHLMIEQPEKSIDTYLSLNLWGITIHYESTRFPARLLSVIRESKQIAGLSINPATPVEAVFDLLPYADMLLIMSVDPGFYGQPFMPQSLKRIEKLAAFAKTEGYDKLRIQADGGINRGNISQVAQAGADIVVAGGAAFEKGRTINENVTLLKEACINFSKP